MGAARKKTKLLKQGVPLPTNSEKRLKSSSFAHKSNFLPNYPHCTSSGKQCLQQSQQNQATDSLVPRYLHGVQSIITNNKGMDRRLPSAEYLTLSESQWQRKLHLVMKGGHISPRRHLPTKITLTLHAKFGSTTVLVDHDKENHQQDAGKSGKPDGDGYL